MKRIIYYLIEKNMTISTMESCTGGFIASSITDIESSSDVFKFGVVTYSNEYKIKMGVSKESIDKYTVYSEEVSKEMAKTISVFTNSNYGIGVTGKLNKIDKNNLFKKDNIVFVCVYDKDKETFYNKSFEVKETTRHKNKEYVLTMIEDMLIDIFFGL